MSSRLRLGVLISGRGSNLRAIYDHIQEGTLAAEIALVVSNRGDASGLEWARQKGFPTACVERKAYPSREAQNAEMVARLKAAGVELVVLAGYDNLIAGSMFDAFPGRIMNIHPSLLPAFGGNMHAQADTLAYGAKILGCTVHYVDDGIVDGGPIILQAAVPVLEDDNVESLAHRILEQEHRIYSRAIQLHADGRLRIEGRRVRIVEERNPCEPSSAFTTRTA